MTIELDREQKEVFLALARGNARVETVGGYAGTGKTTLIGYLNIALGYAVCAYTGKAAHVLRQKGCAAQTIHSTIYQPRNKTMAIDAAQKYLAKLEDEKAEPAAIRAAEERLNDAKRPEFALRPLDKLFDGQDRPVRGFIVDEASMVPRPIFDDLTSFGLRCIFVGDHGQLPPVSEGGDAFNLMAEPMYRLETLHRNAGPIARFAEHLRKGEIARSFRTSTNVVQIIPRGAATTQLLMSADQVICPYNRSRVENNAKIRGCLGRSDILTAGDRIIALRNARDLGIYNGMQGVVSRVDLAASVFDFVDDCGQIFADVLFDSKQFGKEKYEHCRGGPHPFDYGYVVTCHKAQGSEWPHVLVLDQGWKWEYSRWAYTAASRARERLTWVY